MFVESTNGVEGGPEAFQKLESAFATLKGRKFYATYQHPNGPYRACAEIKPGDDPAALGFSVWSIPGGRYARGKLENWSEHPWDIPTVFDDLAQAYSSRLDGSRPGIEFYKSQKELICLLPIE
jgi:hypothetical protein